MQELIKRKKAVVVAADVIGLEKLEELVRATCDVQGIEGYKVGLALGLGNGLGNVVDTIKQYTELPIIYDHQKAGNDIPELGVTFAEVVAEAGCDAVILFPFAGRITQREWTKACKAAGLVILTGGHMTQKGFLASEGGYIDNNAPPLIYSQAVDCGVRNFVVPGNKVEFVEEYRKLLELKIGSKDFTLWAPGFISQGGDITEYAKKAGNNWVAIVGSAIYKAENKRRAAETITTNIK